LVVVALKPTCYGGFRDSDLLLNHETGRAPYLEIQTAINFEQYEKNDWNNVGHWVLLYRK
jgi:hypothetical protein